MYRIGQEEIDAVARVINSKSLFKVNDALRETAKCEQNMRDIWGVKRALLVTSGKGALISALVGMGIGPGDEVIVPGYTYIATAIAVLATGAIPVIADINETLTLDPEDFERKITERTRAVIPVHIMGFPCNMDEIMRIAKKHNILVLEDSCQSDGGSYKGKRLGSIGNAGALSFNYFKIVTAGEGGAVLTNDDVLYERALIYQDSSAIAFFGDQLNGISEQQFCGSQFRTNEISAAILNEQFKRLDGILSDLRKNKRLLKEYLAPYCRFTPSNDEEGDCGVALSIEFDTEEECIAFNKAAPDCTSRPRESDRHIYCFWTAILEKRGAFHPLMDPFKMEANKDHIPDYSVDMCPKTLSHLAKNCYIHINPDWTEEEVKSKAQYYIEALKK
ncbi:MAG: DegT/DnrJ/EryC1/StrS family aminotransferase [Clostridia bacterium]|nr:DegT/DnrJ/EryC1/StrS family aminotransferase [Clostridia bacterium]